MSIYVGMYYSAPPGYAVGPSPGPIQYLETVIMQATPFLIFIYVTPSRQGHIPVLAIQNPSPNTWYNIDLGPWGENNDLDGGPIIRGPIVLDIDYTLPRYQLMLDSSMARN